jgi:hypothetical protein
MASDEVVTKETAVVQGLKVVAGIDWKALLLVLTALGGFGGAIWNRVDATIEKALQARTQKGVYTVLAAQLDTVVARLAIVEEMHGIEVPKAAADAPAPEAPALAQTPVSAPVPSTPVVLEDKATALPPRGEVTVTVRPLPDEVVVAPAVVGRTDLPTFEAIQKSAEAVPAIR